MKRFIKRFTITILIITILFGFYQSYSNDISKKSLTGAAYDSSLVSSSEKSPTGTTVDDQVNSDISFLATLASIKQIKIDKDFFNDSLFNKLHDNTVPIEPTEAGRSNPFAPIDLLSIGGVTSSTPRLITSEADMITNNSANLNGSINIATGVRNIYFEYGLTEVLGSKTEFLKQTLIGAFSKNISGLTPETTYYYRSVAEVNGLIMQGEIKSFTTPK